MADIGVNLVGVTAEQFQLPESRISYLVVCGIRPPMCGDRDVARSRFDCLKRYLGLLCTLIYALLNPGYDFAGRVEAAVRHLIQAAAKNPVMKSSGYSEGDKGSHTSNFGDAQSGPDYCTTV
jgi:hypothetical protein